MRGESLAFQRVGQLRALGRAVLDEPTLEDRVTLGIGVVRGLGRALIQDRIVIPLTIARLNRDRAATIATARLAEVVPLPEVQTYEPMFAEAA
jgi:hypothetical protein